MEREPSFNDPTKSENLESGLRKKGYRIEKMSLSETGPIQCETCMKEGHFDFYDEAWFIEGNAFCQEHKEGALKKLEEADKKAQEEKTKRENAPLTYLRPDNLLEAIGLKGIKGLTEDERAMQRLILEVYLKEGKVYLKEVQRVRATEPKMPLGEVVKKLYEEIEKEQEKKK